MHRQEGSLTYRVSIPHKSPLATPDKFTVHSRITSPTLSSQAPKHKSLSPPSYLTTISSLTTLASLISTTLHSMKFLSILFLSAALSGVTLAADDDYDSYCPVPSASHQNPEIYFGCFENLDGAIVQSHATLGSPIFIPNPKNPKGKSSSDCSQHSAFTPGVRKKVTIDAFECFHFLCNEQSLPSRWVRAICTIWRPTTSGSP